MRYLAVIVLAILLSVTFSCRKDFSTVESFGELSFSDDTIFLDTVFTNIGSATYQLKVYNKSNNDILIPEIKLENGESSNYRLNVDGLPGKDFEDIEILANDSLFIFVETTIDFETTPDPLYTDRILFDNGNNQQDVDLVTLVQDAIFIFPSRDPVTFEIDSLRLDGGTGIFGRYLNPDELTFTNEKPYVIYGYAAVPESETLNIEAGAKIFFHANSGIIVDTGASLNVAGSLENQVIFEGDRLAHDFSQVPGQWGTIWMRKGSLANEINYAEIKNGAIGILVDSIGSMTTPTLKIQNTKVYNHSLYSILGRETHIEGDNLVVGSAGQSSFAGVIGGTYDFTHCTFANYWTGGDIRTLPAVLINNFFEYTDDLGQDIVETRDLNAANFVNCIMEGNGQVEFLLDEVPSGSIFNFNVSNCLIKYNDVNNIFAENENMNFDALTNYQNILLNGNPDFKNTGSNEFSIGESSDAIDNGISTSITIDIIGISRTPTIDIGAYQATTFDSEE